MKRILTNRKGFTLMEIIVVLIIIAVLAAALIPSFVGFIRDARSATVINEARSGMNAAQVILTEERGKGDEGDPFAVAGVMPIRRPTGTTAPTGNTINARFWRLIWEDIAPPTSTMPQFDGIVITGSRVTTLVYTRGDGWVVTIANNNASAVFTAP